MRQKSDFETVLERIGPELQLYEELLTRWQTKMNLVGPSTLDSIRTRHFLDSIGILDFAPLGRVWADLGSGAGFPGMVLGILQKASSQGLVHLIESDRRKAAFLREVSRETGARTQIHSARAEDVLRSLNVDVVTSRAMAPLARLIELSGFNIQNGASGVFIKGQNIGKELTEPAISSNFSIVTHPNPTNSESSIVVVEWLGADRRG